MGEWRLWHWRLGWGWRIARAWMLAGLRAHATSCLDTLTDTTLAVHRHGQSAQPRRCVLHAPDRRPVAQGLSVSRTTRNRLFAPARARLSPALSSCRAPASPLFALSLRLLSARCSIVSDGHSLASGVRACILSLSQVFKMARGTLFRAIPLFPPRERRSSVSAHTHCAVQTPDSDNDIAHFHSSAVCRVRPCETVLCRLLGSERSFAVRCGKSEGACPHSGRSDQSLK